MEGGKWKGLEGAEVKGVEKSRGAVRFGIMICIAMEGGG